MIQLFVAELLEGLRQQFLRGHQGLEAKSNRTGCSGGYLLRNHSLNQHVVAAFLSFQSKWAGLINDCGKYGVGLFEILQGSGDLSRIQSHGCDLREWRLAIRF